MQCHPLETYREGVERFLQFDPAIENLIVTSEDKAACTEFVEMMKKEHPTLRIVLNVGDVQQGTGSGSKLESYTEGATNADVVARWADNHSRTIGSRLVTNFQVHRLATLYLSALTSMHMHMRAKYFVITSSSTWTSTVTLMARAYGFSISDIFVIDLNDKATRLAGLAKTGCYSWASGTKQFTYLSTFLRDKSPYNFHQVGCSVVIVEIALPTELLFHMNSCINNPINNQHQLRKCLDNLSQPVLFCWLTTHP